MDEKERYPRRRDNRVYWRRWSAELEHGGQSSTWMWLAPALVGLVIVIGCFGLAFLGWNGTPRVGP